MNITYAVPRYLPQLGGIENHVAALAAGASRLGHHVTVLTQREDASLPEEEWLGGVRVCRFPSMLSARGQGLSPLLWQRIRALTDATDILHIHNVHAASTLGTLVRARRGPIVLTPHYLGSGEGLGNRLLHRLYDPALGKALRKAAAIICVTRAEARELMSDFRLSEGGLRVIPNGVDTLRLRVALPASANSRVVLVASRLETYKQVALVVEAVSLLPREFSLVIAGAGPEARALGELAARSSASDRVQLVGHLDAAGMASWYRRAAVVVSMSRRECFGMTLAEGLASGCAVVASDIPAHREVIENAGWSTASLVPLTAGAADVAAAIKTSIEVRGGLHPKVMGWAEVVEETVYLYDEVSSSEIWRR